MTPRQRELLTLLTQDEVDGYPPEVCMQGIEAWVGTERFSAATVNSLLRLLALRDTGDSLGKQVERYEISTVGRALLAGTVTAKEISDAVHAGRPFTIDNGGELQWLSEPHHKLHSQEDL